MRTKMVSKVIYNAVMNCDTLLLIGDRGVGKSNLVVQAVDQIAEELKDNPKLLPSWCEPITEGYEYPMVDSMYIHAILSDPTDSGKGMPWVVVNKETGVAKAVFIPLYEMERMMSAKGVLVVVLEDFGQAPPLCQAGYMQKVLAREINGQKISDSVVFIICSNERGADTGVHGILEPMKDRALSIIKVEAFWEDWCEFAMASGRFVPEVIAYHRWCGNSDRDHNHLNKYVPTRSMERSPSPRAWEFISHTIAHGYPKEVIREMFCGTVGQEEGNAFFSFLSQYRELVHPDMVIANPEGEAIPKNPSVLWSVIVALASRANKKNFPAIAIYANRLAKEWGYALISDCIRKDVSLKETKTYVDWAVANSNVLI